MANVITAGNSSNGGTAITTDTSGTLNIVTGSGSGSTAVTVDGSQNLQFNSGYGSVATSYGCRAWVNFNGTGTVAIRASGNVTSLTDNGTGDYTVNFTTAMPDANYAVVASAQLAAVNNNIVITPGYQTNPTTSAVRFSTTAGATGGLFDCGFIYVAVFR